MPISLYLHHVNLHPFLGENLSKCVSISGTSCIINLKMIAVKLFVFTHLNTYSSSSFAPSFPSPKWILRGAKISVYLHFREPFYGHRWIVCLPYTMDGQMQVHLFGSCKMTSLPKCIIKLFMYAEGEDVHRYGT